jgi:hypothetical protein
MSIYMLRMYVRVRGCILRYTIRHRTWPLPAVALAPFLKPPSPDLAQQLLAYMSFETDFYASGLRVPCLLVNGAFGGYGRACLQHQVITKHALQEYVHIHFVLTPVCTLGTNLSSLPCL